MPGREVDRASALLHALPLRICSDCKVLGAHEVRRRLLAPSDLAWWLRERRQRLSREPRHRLVARRLVAVLEEEPANHVGVDPDRAVVTWLHPRRRFRTDELAL